MRSPPLQRKEARPVGVLLFLWALFMFPIASCGGMGAYKLGRSRDAVVAVSNPADLETLALGGYVDTTLHLTQIARDSLPAGDRYSYIARGYTAYAVAELPNLVVIAEEPNPQPNGPTQLVGQLCDGDAKLICTVGNEGVAAYARGLARRREVPVRVLLAGAVPHDNLVEASIGLGVAGFVLLCAVFASLLVLYKAKSSGTMAFERTISLRMPPERLRAVIRAQTSSVCRIAHDSPERMVLLAGKPASAARLTGATDSRDIPLRIDIEFGGQDAYRHAAATVRVIYLLGGPVVPFVRLAGQGYPQPTAAEAAGAWILGLCEQS
jgi:hypothetical protein